MTDQGQLFSAAALSIRDSQRIDPVARGKYDIWSGGLFWPDEFPPLRSPEWNTVAADYIYRSLIAYRASITVGDEREEFKAVWDQVIQFAPHWPGLREDRRGERARKRLLAAKRREAHWWEQESQATDAKEKHK